MDISSQSTTIVHQIFGGFLRSRGTFPQLLLSLALSVPFCLPVTNSCLCEWCSKYDMNRHGQSTSPVTEHFTLPSSHVLELQSCFRLLRGLPGYCFGYQSKRACNCASRHPKAPLAFQSKHSWLKNIYCDRSRTWWWVGGGMECALLGRPWLCLPEVMALGWTRANYPFCALGMLSSLPSPNTV